MNTKHILKTSTLALACAAVATSFSQAATTLTAIDGNIAVEDSDGVDFSGQSVTTTLNNWGYNDTFVGANLTNTTFTFNGGNQPFLNSTITGADFGGATFNYTPFGGAGAMRVNLFRHEVAGADYAGASFANTTWNIALNGSSVDVANSGFFNDGSGSTNAASAANAVDFTGADFNFSGTSAALFSDDVGNLLITNLGGTDGGTNIGAKYDDAFVTNNFAAFGYADEAALETALDAAGWQAVPEPSSTALLGLGGLALVLRRRK